MRTDFELSVIMQRIMNAIFAACLVSTVHGASWMEKISPIENVTIATKNDTVQVKLPLNSTFVISELGSTTAIPTSTASFPALTRVPVLVNGTVATDASQLPPLVPILQPHHKKALKDKIKAGNKTKKAFRKRSPNATRTARQVEDTIHEQDEVVGPDGSRTVVGTSEDSQIAPVAVAAPPQVTETTEVQNSVVRPDGVEVPVGSSSDVSRVNRQFHSSGISDTMAVEDSVIPQVPEAVDTTDVQDTVIGPSGVEIPVGSLSEQTRVARQFSGFVQPSAFGTVQVQDSVVHPSGFVVPVSAASNTQVSSAGGPPFASGQDVTTVEDTVVGPSGQVVPVGGAVVANPSFGALAGHAEDVTTVEDRVIHPSGQIIPVGGVVAANPVGLPVSPQVHDETVVEDSVVHPSGIVTPVGGALFGTQADDAFTVEDTILHPSGLVTSAGSAVLPVGAVVAPQVEDTETVQDSVVAPNGAEVVLAQNAETQSNGFHKRSLNASFPFPNRRTTFEDLKALEKNFSTPARPFPKTIVFTNANQWKAAPFMVEKIPATTFAPIVVNFPIPTNNSISKAKFFLANELPENVSVAIDTQFNKSALFSDSAAVPNSREMVEIHELAQKSHPSPFVALQISNQTVSTTPTPEHSKNTTTVLQVTPIVSAVVADKANSATTFHDEQPLPTKEDLEIAAEKSFLRPKNGPVNESKDPRDDFGIFSPREYFNSN